MGQRDGFSKGDITKINTMYKCPEKTGTVTKQSSNGSKPTGDKNFLSAVGNFFNLFKS